jgi:hypothetical protein
MDRNTRSKLLRKPWSRADAIRAKAEREERSEIIAEFRAKIRKEKENGKTESDQ